MKQEKFLGWVGFKEIPTVYGKKVEVGEVYNGSMNVNCKPQTCFLDEFSYNEKYSYFLELEYSEFERQTSDIVKIFSCKVNNIYDRKEFHAVSKEFNENMDKARNILRLETHISRLGDMADFCREAKEITKSFSDKVLNVKYFNALKEIRYRDIYITEDRPHVKMHAREGVDFSYNNQEEFLYISKEEWWYKIISTDAYPTRIKCDETIQSIDKTIDDILKRMKEIQTCIDKYDFLMARDAVIKMAIDEYNKCMPAFFKRDIRYNTFMYIEKY